MTFQQRVEAFIRAQGGDVNIGHVTDIHVSSGNLKVLVTRPHGFKAALSVLLGKYSPSVGFFHLPDSR